MPRPIAMKLVIFGEGRPLAGKLPLVVISLQVLFYCAHVLNLCVVDPGWVQEVLGGYDLSYRMQAGDGAGLQGGAEGAVFTGQVAGDERVLVGFMHVCRISYQLFLTTIYYNQCQNYSPFAHLICPNIIMVKVSNLILQHLQSLLQPYLNPSGYMPALDYHLSSYFRSHKSLGPSQRRDLYNLSYDLIRYHYYLSHLVKGSTDLAYRVQLLHSSDFYAEMSNEKLAKWIRCSFPKVLYDKIVDSLGSEYEAFQMCKALNTRAPLTIRINPLKTTRADFMKKISSFLKLELQKTEISPYGVVIPSNKNIDLHSTQQFKTGHFEVQDQASQIAALQVQCRPGDIVLDYCSGSGGKSLAISHLLEGKGQLYLHDPRPKTLINAKNRFQRAGIQNVQFHNDEVALEKTLKNKADWLILDVPCSGTGTIRRNPDIKLKFSEELLKSHVLRQEQIFARSLKYLKKSGKIAYITCSLLYEENEGQVKKFIKQFNLEVVNNEILRTKTARGKMDSMFAAVLQRKKQ